MFSAVAPSVDILISGLLPWLGSSFSAISPVASVLPPSVLHAEASRPVSEVPSRTASPVSSASSLSDRGDEVSQPDSPPMHEFWRDHLDLYEFIVIWQSSMVPTNKNLPVLPGGSLFADADYALHEKSLQIFPPGAKRWTRHLAFPPDLHDEFLHLPSSIVYFRTRN